MRKPVEDEVADDLSFHHPSEREATGIWHYDISMLAQDYPTLKNNPMTS